MAFGSPQWMYSAGKYEIDQSLKFNDDDTAYLSKTFASSGNTKKWTYSCWYKRGDLDGQSHTLFATNRAGSNDFDYIRVQTDDSVYVAVRDNSSSYVFRIITNRKLRDPSAWYHILVKFDSTASTPSSTDCALYINGVRETDLAGEVLPSQNDTTRFNSNVEHYVGQWNSDSSFYLDGHLAEVNFIDGQALDASDFGETGTYGEWKPIEYSGTYGTNGFYLPFKADYSVEGFSTVTWRGNGVNSQYIGGTGFRPSLTWIKERSSTSAHQLHDQVRGAGNALYSNDTGQEDYSSTTLQAFSNDGFTVGSHGAVNASGDTYVAWNWDMGADTPTGFGCVTYKGNGGTQSISGFGFSPDLVWVKNRSSAEEHALVDTVRGANKILESDTSDTEATYTDGLTKFDPDGFSIGGSSRFSANSDNYVAWGWDMGGTSVSNTSGSITSTVRANTTYGQSIVKYTSAAGACTVGHGLSSAPELILYKTLTSNDWVVYHTSVGNANKLRLNTNAAQASTSDFNSTSPTSSVFTDSVTGGATNMIAYCFHSVSGYSKIGSFSGSGSSGNTITTGFRPAFLLVKQTNASGENWYIFDSTREPLGELDTALKPDESNAEATSSTKKVEFTSTGFKLNSTNSALNASGSTYIYYAVAGGMDSISTYNTTGSIDSRVKANPTYGQSIVSYVGTGSAMTVGHGLDSTPEMIITKSRDRAENWFVYHEATGTGREIFLNTNGADGSNTNAMTAVNATTFASSGDSPNRSGDNHIAYCFHSVTGYSKFGSYTGNGSATGTSVTTGFKPAFVMLKRTDGTGNWMMFDSTRSPTNTISDYLVAHDSQAEASYPFIDFNANGFQLKHTSSHANGNGNTYIYMAFADKREYAYWLDQSGQNNDWTSNNLTESDISVDSPTNNFATLNPLDRVGTLNLKEGNLHYQSTLGMVRGTMAGNANDKFYLEYYQESNITGSNPTMIGIGAIEDQPHHESNHRASVMCHLDGNSQKRVRIFLNNSQVQSTDFDALKGYNVGDILQFAYDGTTGKVWVGRNGNWLQGNPATGTSPIYTFSDTSKPMTAYVDHAGVAHSGRINFGQDSSFGGRKTAQGYTDDNGKSDFYYEPPSGFLALSSANLKDAGLTPSEHFNTLLYTGNDATGRSVTGVGFSPSFIWFKERNNTAHHVLHDAVRGASGGRLSSNRNNAEDASTSIASFDSDGFTVGSSAAYINSNNANIAAFNWKANGSGSSNTDGSVTTTVSANVDAGFSIATYTGTGASATFGHGLSKAPEISIYKIRSQGYQWMVYTGNLNPPSTTSLVLDTTGAGYNAGGTYGTHGASTFALLSNADVNGNGQTYVSYHFHSVDGYSKMGYYTGNINTNGSFVYTGFKPAFIMLKPTTRTGHWMITNNKSTTYNPVNKVIFANDSAPEYTNPTAAVLIDYLANGFKLRTNDDNSNGDADTYIYMAFAEVPFKYGNAG